VPYELRAASTGGRPSPDPDAKRKLVAAVAEAGFLDSADDMRPRPTPGAPALSPRADPGPGRVLHRGATPRRPSPGPAPGAAGCVRANIRFLPIRDAWFSGSMNYLGRARTPEGKPEYEASYEINASLQISEPEFRHLVSHEVVPGHVTTFAFLQDLYWRGEVGFEASVLTMNTRAAACSRIANAILIAHGDRGEDCPTRLRRRDPGLCRTTPRTRRPI
jgi:hypothetical protein